MNEFRTILTAPLLPSSSLPDAESEKNVMTKGRIHQHFCVQHFGWEAIISKMENGKQIWQLVQIIRLQIIVELFSWFIGWNWMAFSWPNVSFPFWPLFLLFGEDKLLIGIITTTYTLGDYIKLIRTDYFMGPNKWGQTRAWMCLPTHFCLAHVDWWNRPKESPSKVPKCRKKFLNVEKSS